MNGPSHICYYFSWSCNSKCLSCNNWMKTGYNELNLSEVKEMFSNPLLQDVIHVYLTGGEPFLSDKVVDICKILKDKLDATISLNTNGLLPENVERYSRQVRDLDLDILSFDLSINGPEEVHNYTRGTPEGYKRLMSSHKAIEKLGIPHSWNYTIFKHTLPYINWYKHEFLPSEAKTFAFGISKRALGSPDEALFDFTDAELDHIYSECEDTSLRAYLKYIKAGGNYLPSCRMGDRQIRIDPGGIAYICDIAPVFRAGKVTDLTPETFHHRVKQIKQRCMENCIMEYCIFNFNQLINNWRNRIIFQPSIYRQLAHSRSTYHKMWRL